MCVSESVPVCSDFIALCRWSQSRERNPVDEIVKESPNSVFSLPWTCLITGMYFSTICIAFPSVDRSKHFLVKSVLFVVYLLNAC